MVNMDLVLGLGNSATRRTMKESLLQAGETGEIRFRAAPCINISMSLYFFTQPM